MGNTPSDGTTAASLFDPAQTTALEKIVSEQSYMMSDVVWSTFFSISPNLVNTAPEILDAFLKPFAHAFAKNTIQSGNFRMLIRHLTRSMRYMTRHTSGPWKNSVVETTVLAMEIPQALNVLVVVRNFCREFIERQENVLLYMSTDGMKDISISFDQRQPSTERIPSDEVAFDFLDALFCVLLEPPTELLYDFQLECINLLLVLVSSTDTSTTKSQLFSFLMKQAASNEHEKASYWAPGLVKRFLVSYLDQLPAPRPEAASAIASHSVLPSSSSWNVVGFFSDTNVYPFADRGILALLVLVSSSQNENPFRDALRHLNDRDESAAAHAIAFSHVAGVMGQHLGSDIHVALLYHCITLNPTFRDALCRPLDMDHFVLPLLEAIYSCLTDPHPDATRLYLRLAVLLHLTENPIVVQTLHQTMLDDPIVWYTERYLCDLSVGSLVLILLCRTIKVNLAILCDPFIHTLTFGIKWNMMQYAKHLHPSATQSILKLLSYLVKREGILRNVQPRDQGIHDERITYLSCIRHVLECIQPACYPRLATYNSQLIYSMLHASDVFELLKLHPDEELRLDDAHTKIQGTVAYFRAIVDQEDTEEDIAVLSVEDVLERIQIGSKKLAHSESKHDQPSIYFAYEEGESAEEFFLPFLWQLIHIHTKDIAWSPKRNINLFFYYWKDLFICGRFRMGEEDVLEDIDFDELDDHLEQFQQDDFIKEALAKGVDLRQYAQQIDRELRDVEMESITQYVAKSADIVDLYNQVQSCDDILAKMQEMLLGFQADLGGISDEIRNLQNESIGMNIKLKNRREAEEILRLFLDQVYIPPTLIEGIDEGEVNEAFVSYLMILNSKLAYSKLDQAAPTSLGAIPAKVRAVQQVDGDLEKLKHRACSQIREWLLGRINDLKKPKTNLQIVQQSTLLKMKYVLVFLNDQAPNLSNEFRDTYAETMSRILVTVFKAYHTGLMKFVEECASRTDVIAVEEASLKSMFSSRVNVKQTNAFAMGERDKILEAAVQPPILIHMAQAEGLKCSYEVLFRSTQIHLINAATSEYLFLLDFFKSTEGRNPIRIRELFLRVFAKTLSLGLEQLENYLCTSYDAIGLLLMIRLTLNHIQVMEQRRIPVLDTYFERILLLLWPRFHAVLELNIQSVKQAKPKKLGNIELHPHYITRRYAEFIASLLGYIPDGGNQVKEIYMALTVLCQSFVELLEKLSENHKNIKEKCVFLINNYDFIVSVVEERKITSDETTKLNELLVQQRERFVEEELVTWYGNLILFVQQTEIKRPETLESSKVERIVREFNTNWKNGIEKINGNVMKYFSNFRNGMEILKQVLTQLLLYYTRFVELVKKSWTRPPSFSNDIVTTQEILYEIKKYSRSF